MIADDLAHHRAEIGRALQVAAGALEHRAIHARLPGHRIRRAAVENTTVGHLAGGVGAQPLDAATGDIHDAGLGVVGAVVGILDGGATELRQGHDDQVVPAALVGIPAEILPERVDRPADPLQQACVGAGDPALVAVGVPAVDLGTGHEGIGLVEDQCRRLELVEVAVGGSGNHIAGIGVPGRSRSVLGVGGREQMIRSFPVGVVAVDEGVAGLAEIHAGEDLQRAPHVFILLLEEVPIDLAGECRSGGCIQRSARLEIAFQGVGNAQQVVAGRIGQIRHRRTGSAQEERQRILEGDAGQRVLARTPRLDHRSVEQAVLHHVGPRSPGLPVGLGVEMRTRLLRISHPVDEGQFTRIVDRRQEFECRMQSGKPIAQWQ